MMRVKEGDTIRILYKGRLEDGTIFDSTENKSPLDFTVGEGEVIPGLERGVVGMASGESKTIIIPMEQGYGPLLREKIQSLDRKKLPGNFQPYIGQQLQMYRADGMPVVGTVTALSETSLTMDYNHPLAGKTLIFETELLDIL